MTDYRNFFIAVLVLALPSPLCAAEPLSVVDQVLREMRWRSLGPAVMGGRIADIGVDPKNPFKYYVALATGGLLKTTNDGDTWSPLFDDQSVASIGSVAVAPSDPAVIWVGTGEANGRNSSSWGNGVYRSTDGGTTWTHAGLERTQQIGRIVVDPKDANTAWAAAPGRLWGPNRQRGVFKTSDGGKTWKQVLRVDRDTGAIDLALGDPKAGVMFAATYSRRRYPWGFQGLGEGAGIWKSSDHGDTWKRITTGLPAGPLGRIGLAVAGSKPDIVYAVVETPAGGSTSLFDPHSNYGGVFRSDDSGETWRRVNPSAPRGFYFSQIRNDRNRASTGRAGSGPSERG